MLDIGPLELLVIIVLAVMLFGPERLPRMIAQAATWLRVLRDQATSARDELMSAVDLDPEVTGELRKSMNDLAQMHPRKMASGFLGDLVKGNDSSAAQSNAPATMRPSGSTGAVSPAAPAADGSTSAPTGAAPSGTVAFDADAT
jgi:sec-independent protein translocase protein TatB